MARDFACVMAMMEAYKGFYLAVNELLCAAIRNMDRQPDRWEWRYKTCINFLADVNRCRMDLLQTLKQFGI